MDAIPCGCNSTCTVSSVMAYALSEYAQDADEMNTKSLCFWFNKVFCHQGQRVKEGEQTNLPLMKILLSPQKLESFPYEKNLGQASVQCLYIIYGNSKLIYLITFISNVVLKSKCWYNSNLPILAISIV